MDISAIGGVARIHASKNWPAIPVEPKGPVDPKPDSTPLESPQPEEKPITIRPPAGRHSIRGQEPLLGDIVDIQGFEGTSVPSGKSAKLNSIDLYA